MAGFGNPLKQQQQKVKVKPLSYLNVSILVHELYTVPSSDVRFSRMSYGCKLFQVLIEFLLLNHTTEFQISPRAENERCVLLFPTEINWNIV